METKEISLWGCLTVALFWGVIVLRPESALANSPALASLASGQKVGQTEEPFGLRRQTPDARVFEKWNEVETQIAKERKILADCRSALSPCPAAAVRFLAAIHAGDGRTALARIGTINRAVNMAIAYNTVAKSEGSARWSTPLSTFASNKGLCADYAIAKLVALEEAGIRPADLRIVIVHLTQGKDHAIVAIRYDGEWLILDNRNLALITDTRMPRVVPLFDLGQTDHNGTVLFAAAGGGVPVGN